MTTAQQPSSEVVLVPPTINHDPGRYSLAEIKFPQELVDDERNRWYDRREVTVCTVESVIYSISPTSRTNAPDILYIYLAGVSTPIIRLVTEVNPNAKVQPGDRLRITRSFKQGDDESIHIRAEEISLVRETDDKKTYQHLYPRGGKEKRLAAHRQRLH